MLLAAMGKPSMVLAQTERATVSVQWSNVVRSSKTTPTLQVVVNPLLRRGSKIHEQSFRWLKEMHADYVRYVPWLPYPRLGVAELSAPAGGKDVVEFFADRSVDDRFFARDGRSFDGFEFQHDTRVDDEDGWGSEGSCRPRRGGLGLRAGERVAGSFGERSGGILCATSELVCAGRL